MRRSFSRTSNGPGALVPSPMFVAATVRLLLPPVTSRRITDAKSLRQPRLSDCRRPVPRGDDQGRWMATGRPQRRLATRRIRLPYNRLRFVMDEGPPGPVPARWPEGPCDGCEAPASGFRGPRRSPVFLPVCRHRGMSGLRPWEALTGEVRYRIDAFGGHCPGRRVSQTVPPH